MLNCIDELFLFVYFEYADDFDRLGEWYSNLLHIFAILPSSRNGIPLGRKGRGLIDVRIECLFWSILLPISAHNII
jgi:hypothetical protein